MKARTQSIHYGTASKLLLIFSILLAWAASDAQAHSTVTIRMLDSKTGEQITTSEFQISFHALPDLSKIPGLDPYWMEGGERHGILEVPFEPDGVSMAVHSSFGPANWAYFNCDSVKDRAPYLEHWYLITDILKSGVVAPNHCNNRQAVAKPGEFKFFVRPPTFWEKMRE